jgi:hypothetical protein
MRLRSSLTLTVCMTTYPAHTSRSDQDTFAINTRYS